MRKEVRRDILRIALPSMGSSIFYMAYGIVDLMWIGMLGKEAIASVTLAMSFYNVNYILNEIFGVASIVILARRWGEGRRKEFERVGRQIVIYKFFAGIFLAFVTIPLAELILVWMGGGKVPSGDAVSYYTYRAFFLPFSFLGGTMMTTFRSIGDTKTLFIVSAIGASANIFLDPVLMFWAGMGVVGSALASGICETSAMLLGFYLAHRKWNVWLLKPTKLEFEILKKVFVIGGPSLLDSINWNISRFVTVKIFSSLGVLATATLGIFFRIVEIGWMVGFALEGAVTTLVGQSLGARVKERAREVFREGFKMGGLMGGMFTLVVLTMAPFIAGFFAHSEDLLSSATTFLKISSFGFFFMPLLNVAYGTLIGGGRTLDTFYIGLVSNWGFRIPMMWIVSTLTGDYMPLGIIFSTSIAVGVAMGLLAIKREKWLKMIV